MPTNYSYTKNGITFSEIHKHGLTIYEPPAFSAPNNYTVSGTNIESKQTNVFNVVDIDFNGASISGVSGTISSAADFITMLSDIVSDIESME